MFLGNSTTGMEGCRWSGTFAFKAGSRHLIPGFDEASLSFESNEVLQSKFCIVVGRTSTADRRRGETAVARWFVSSGRSRSPSPFATARRRSTSAYMRCQLTIYAPDAILIALVYGAVTLAIDPVQRTRGWRTRSSGATPSATHIDVAEVRTK